MNEYGLKMIYRIRAGSRLFYEESIVRVRAESADEAYEKAEGYALGMCADEYVNVCGELVKTELAGIIDCFQAFGEEDGVQEVYSRIAANRTGLNEEQWFGALSDGCTAQDMLPLRRRELNEGLARELQGRE